MRVITGLRVFRQQNTTIHTTGFHHDYIYMYRGPQNPCPLYFLCLTWNDFRCVYTIKFFLQNHFKLYLSMCFKHKFDSLNQRLFFQIIWSQEFQTFRFSGKI